MVNSSVPLPTWRNLSAAARWVLVSVFVTNIGTGIQNLAVAKLLYDATGSTVDFGLTLIIENILTFGLQLIAGPVVDRGRPSTVMVVADLARGSIVCASSIFLANGHVFWWVATAVVAINVARPFYRSANFSLGPLIAGGDQLLLFNSIRGTVVQAGQMLGVAIAGPLIYLLGPTPAFAVNGISYLLAAGAVAAIRVPRLTHQDEGEDTPRSFIDDWAQVLKYLQGQWALAFHMLLVSGDFLVVSFLNIALVPIVAVDLHNQVYWLSVLDGSFALGSLLTSSLSPRIIRRLGYRMAILGALGSETILFVGLSSVHQIIYLASIMILFGAANTVSVASFMTTLQDRVGADLRGRISSARSFALSILSLGLIPLVTHGQSESLHQGLWMSAVVTFMFFVGTVVLGSRFFFGRQLLGIPDPDKS